MVKKGRAEQSPTMQLSTEKGKYVKLNKLDNYSQAFALRTIAMTNIAVQEINITLPIM